MASFPAVAKKQGLLLFWFLSNIIDNIPILSIERLNIRFLGHMAHNLIGPNSSTKPKNLLQ